MTGAEPTLIDRVRTDRAVTVLGDLVLDEYVRGQVTRISPEAPIPVLRADAHERRPGGAANVACNVAALGAHVRCLGAIGADAEGDALLSLLTHAAVDARDVVRDGNKPTAHKTRMMAQGQQILRVDRESTAPLAPLPTRALGRAIDESPFDLLVISDYAKGTLGRELIASAMATARARGAPVIVGLKGRDADKYRGATGAMLNRAELEQLTQETSVERGGHALRELLALEFLAVTLGEGGIAVFAANVHGAPLLVRAEAREVFDVTGAGDTALAAFALGFASGLSLTECARLANVAAGIAVGRLGTAVVSRPALRRALRHTSAKQLDLDELAAVVAEERARGRRIVFTNGCYDMLHTGHVQSLEFARAQGDFLIVALNGDASVARQKGPSRPVVGEDERARMLSALACVDAVVQFDHDTPQALIERLRPDVLVKGADYAGREVVGREIVEAHGGAVVLAPLVDGVSTTTILHRILRGGA